jgi:hypothetical protein
VASGHRPSRTSVLLFLTVMLIGLLVVIAPRTVSVVGAGSAVSIGVGRGRVLAEFVPRLKNSPPGCRPGRQRPRRANFAGEVKIAPTRVVAPRR